MMIRNIDRIHCLQHKLLILKENIKLISNYYLYYIIIEIQYFFTLESKICIQ